MASDASDLIRRAVERRSDGRPIHATVEWAAAELGLDPERVMRAYARATTDSQEEVIRFLRQDHGELVELHSVLDHHPLSEYFELVEGDYVIARFADGEAWVVWSDGLLATVTEALPAKNPIR